MSDKICIQCRVYGKVQGVWYRANTQQQAIKLGLTGWAKNMPDGTVEVTACGTESAIQSLLAWLKEGPPQAEVAELVYEEIDYFQCEEFKIY